MRKRKMHLCRVLEVEVQHCRAQEAQGDQRHAADCDPPGPCLSERIPEMGPIGMNLNERTKENKVGRKRIGFNCQAGEALLVAGRLWLQDNFYL